MMVKVVKKVLEHPLTSGFNVDDPATTELRRKIIQEKKFLKYLYEEWYGMIQAAIPEENGYALELGSGGGFLTQSISEVISSEVFFCHHVALVADGTRLPISAGALKAIVMTDVLHHIPNIRFFFMEASRCIKTGGRIIMVEPWVTNFSKLIYQKLHHESFLPQATSWDLTGYGHLSMANGALPWILFVRDRAIFQKEFPEWKIERVFPFMPFRYLLSGGVSTRLSFPSIGFPILRKFEQLLSPWMDHIAMFAFVVLEKCET